MKIPYGLPLALGIGLVLGSDAATAGDSSALLRNAREIEQDLDLLGEDPSAITAAFKLVEQYDNEEGPLFINDATKGGMSREPKDGMELHYAMFAIQQGLIDKAYTAENLKNNSRVLKGKTFGTAAYFPGMVAPPADPNAVLSTTINSAHPKGWSAPINGRTAPARRPTGWYLAPGSIGEVAVPPSMVNKGYTVRVGAHSWDLIKKKRSKRLDRVTTAFPITSTRTLIANPLGGGIYIEIPYETEGNVEKIQAKNVIRSPFFSAKSFDQTTLEEWKDSERNHPGPWADFETDKFMMQVPTEWIYKLEDPVTLMQDWDKAMDAISELFGRPYIRPKSVLYLQVDVDMRGTANFPGYPQSNYPYKPDRKTDGLSNHWMVKGPQYSDWTVFHEVGHSQFCSKFRGEIEALVNLPTVAVLNKHLGWSLDKAFGHAIGDMDQVTIDDVAVMWMVTENFRQGNEMNHSNRPGDEMKYQHRGFGKYIEIVNLFGWDALSRFWYEENANWKPEDRVPNNADPTDDRILRLSRAAGYDLRPLIHFWGIQPENPEALAASIQEEGLLPARPIFDRLQHYKTVIPMDNAAFKQHTDVIYPNGLKGRKNPKFGPGWYEVQLPLYSDEYGEKAQAALQDIINLYFPNMT